MVATIILFPRPSVVSRASHHKFIQAYVSILRGTSRKFAPALLRYKLLRHLAASAYSIWLHPLSKFPGPRAAAFSRRWIYKLSENAFVEADLARLHEVYGMSLAKPKRTSNAIC
jgi:hypothetical protein